MKIKSETIIAVRQWSMKNAKLRNVIWYLLFPVTIPLLWISIWWIRRVTFNMLDEAIKTKNDNHVFQICAQHLKNMIEIHKWKYKFSKKWFSKSILKENRQMYDRCILDKGKISFNYFLTLIDVYMNYNIIGGALFNEQSDAVTVEIR